MATSSVSMAWAKASSEPAPWRHNLGALRDMSSSQEEEEEEEEGLFRADAVNEEDPELGLPHACAYALFRGMHDCDTYLLH